MGPTGIRKEKRLKRTLIYNTFVFFQIFIDTVEKFINSDNMRAGFPDTGNTLIDSIDEAAGMKISAEISLYLAG